MNNDTKKHGEGHFRTYIIGFLLSVVLTLASYFTVVEHLFSAWWIVLTIFGFGLVQVFVQLIFFLHLGQEPKPRWKLTVFLFMLLVLSIIVFGSIWIMDNLMYNLGTV